ncbi:MAG: hypothetical protein CMN76_14495 [Spirochaetaceae bacterium]|nr:hypothetical protein [Spirochaetaceae bacterium]|tara:strand:+ start:108799 stop:109797 length:999 start_codon:yes stop_codon:yes gene_type:complete
MRPFPGNFFFHHAGLLARKTAIAGLLMAAATTVAFSPSSELSAESPDFTNMGELLKTNRGDLEFINVAVSNLPLTPENGAEPTEGMKTGLALKEKLSEKMKLAVEHDFFAGIYYLQGNYGHTYRELSISRDLLQQIYREILEYYIDGTWVLLESAAPIILRTQDAKSKHFLQLGFRDLESSRLFHQRGSNIGKKLHTNQINFYREGIKRVRRARKYGILAILESRTPLEEKKEYQYVSYDEQRNPPVTEDVKEYDRILNRMIGLISRKLVDATLTSSTRGYPIELDLIEMHQDNFGAIIPDHPHLLNRMLSEVETAKFHERKKLPERSRIGN